LEVLENGPTKDNWPQALLGERRVLRFPGRGSTLGPVAVIWIQGTSLTKIDSPSLPVALAMEKWMWKKN
jgi:hypothetical protein